MLKQKMQVFSTFEKFKALSKAEKKLKIEAFNIDNVAKFKKF